MILRNVIFIIIAIIALLYLLQSKPQLGGVISSVCSSAGGIVTCSYKVPLKTGTNVPCSIRAPEATSTIEHASADIRTSASSTLMVEIGKANNNTATTTLLGSLTLAANTLGTLVATSSLYNADNFIIAPLNYVNVRFGLPSGYSSGLNGNCEVILRVIS